jgi:ATP-dependent Clp protease ATP-binding subunit ClpC
MFERFADRSLKVMALANQEAQRCNHEYLGTEHILLGLLKEGGGVGAKVLANSRVDLRKARLEVEKRVKSGPPVDYAGKLPQTPRAKRVIEYAIEESRNLHHSYIGTEHLLLGLLREQDGVAAGVLMELGVQLGQARDEVLRVLSGEDQPSTAHERPAAPVVSSQSPPPSGAAEGFLDMLLSELSRLLIDATKSADRERVAVYRDLIEDARHMQAQLASLQRRQDATGGPS